MTADTPPRGGGRADGPTDAEKKLKRAKLGLAASLGLLSLLPISGLVWLFGPADHAGSGEVDTSNAELVDGTLTLVNERRLVMKPFEPLEGDSEVEFTIPEEELEDFDIAHLQSHSAVGLPTRVFYEEDGGGGYVAVLVEDAPVNSSQP